MNTEKYSKIISKIEDLTEAVIKSPASEELKRELKKAEDCLCRMIQKEEKEIDKLLNTLYDNDQALWEE